MRRKAVKLLMGHRPFSFVRIHPILINTKREPLLKITPNSEAFSISGQWTVDSWQTHVKRIMRPKWRKAQSAAQWVSMSKDSRHCPFPLLRCFHVRLLTNSRSSKWESVFFYVPVSDCSEPKHNQWTDVPIEQPTQLLKGYPQKKLVIKALSLTLQLSGSRIILQAVDFMAASVAFTFASKM